MTTFHKIIFKRENQSCGPALFYFDIEKLLIICSSNHIIYNCHFKQKEGILGFHMMSYIEVLVNVR